MPIKYSYSLYSGNPEYYKTYDNELKILEERAKANDKQFFSQILLGCNKVTATNGEVYNFKAIQFFADADSQKKIKDYCADFIESFGNLSVPENIRQNVVNFVNSMSNHTLAPEELSNIQLNSTKVKTDKELDDFYKAEGFVIPENDEEREREEQKLKEIQREQKENVKKQDKAFKISLAKDSYEHNVIGREKILERITTFEELVNAFDNVYTLSPAEQDFYNYFLQKSEESETVSKEEIAEYENERNVLKQNKINTHESINQRIKADNDFDDELEQIDKETELGINAIRENNLSQNLTSFRFVKGLEIAEFMHYDNAVAQKTADLVKDAQTEYNQMSAAGRFFSYFNPFSNPYGTMRNKIKSMKTFATNKLGLNAKDLNDYVNGKTEEFPDKNPSLNYKTINKAIMQARINEANGIEYVDREQFDKNVNPENKVEQAKVERIEDKSFKISADDVDIQEDSLKKAEREKQNDNLENDKPVETSNLGLN